MWAPPLPYDWKCRGRRRRLTEFFGKGGRDSPEQYFPPRRQCQPQQFRPSCLVPSFRCRKKVVFLEEGRVPVLLHSYSWRAYLKGVGKSILRSMKEPVRSIACGLGRGSLGKVSRLALRRAIAFELPFASAGEKPAVIALKLATSPAPSAAPTRRLPGRLPEHVDRPPRLQTAPGPRVSWPRNLPPTPRHRCCPN